MLIATRFVIPFVSLRWYLPPGPCKSWLQQADYPGRIIDEFRLPCLGADDLDERALPHILPGDVLIAGPVGMHMVEEPVPQAIQDQVFSPVTMTVVQYPTAFQGPLDGVNRTPTPLPAPHGAVPGDFTGCRVDRMKLRTAPRGLSAFAET